MRSPMLWCLVSAALFGAATPVSKPLLASLGPLQLSGLLYLGAALAVAPRALATPAVRPRQPDLHRDRLRLAGTVTAGGLIGPVLLLWGLSLAPAASVALWLNLETVATALLARLFFGEHLGRHAWLAVTLTVLASVVLAPDVPSGGLAIGLVGLACCAWGLDNNLTSLITSYSPAQVTLAKGLVAGSANLALGLSWTLIDPHWAAILAALLVGGLSYGASLLLYVASAQQMGAMRSQLVFSTAPLWGVALAAAVLKEPVGGMHLFAVLLMAAAVWLLAREQHVHEHDHPALTHTHLHRHDDGHHGHEHGDEFNGTWHSHPHTHAPQRHTHAHWPDLHHRHEH